MQRSLRELLGYSVHASDGNLGTVWDFFFDDARWTVRYLVVDMNGRWPGGRKVLISPTAFVGHPDWFSRRFSVQLTRDQVKNSPEIDADQPVSRPVENILSAYYGWPIYWGPTPLPGDFMGTEPLFELESGREANPETKRDHSLCAAREIMKYHIETLEGRVGRVNDLILDDENWVLRYLVIDTGAVLPGKKVLVAPDWITQVDWNGSLLHTELHRKELEESPTYHPAQAVNREFEERLYDYLKRPKYWGP